MTLSESIPSDVLETLADQFGLTVEQVVEAPLCQTCADLGVRKPGHGTLCGCCCLPEDVILCEDCEEWVRGRFTCPFHGDCC